MRLTSKIKKAHAWVNAPPCRARKHLQLDNRQAVITCRKAKGHRGKHSNGWLSW